MNLIEFEGLSQYRDEELALMLKMSIKFLDIMDSSWLKDDWFSQKSFGPCKDRTSFHGKTSPSPE